jgi:hypothetical protein
MPTLAEEFAAFWSCYPRKVSRQDAMKAYAKARLLATAEEILDGAKLFSASVYEEQRSREEMRFVPHAATWLNKERWTDSYDVPAPAPKLTYDACYHQPTCNSPQWCLVLRDREAKARAS